MSCTFCTLSTQVDIALAPLASLDNAVRASIAADFAVRHPSKSLDRLYAEAAYARAFDMYLALCDQYNAEYDNGGCSCELVPITCARTMAKLLGATAFTCDCAACR